MPCLGLLHWFINFVSSPAPLSYLWAHLALVLPLAAAHVVVGEAHVAPHRAHLDRDQLTLVAGIQLFKYSHGESYLGCIDGLRHHQHAGAGRREGGEV